MVFKLILQPCRVHACEENGILQHPPHRSKSYFLLVPMQFTSKYAVYVWFNCETIK